MAKEKVVRIGTVDYYGKRVSVFCEIGVKNGELSITGVVGPKRNGDAEGGCGQIDLSEYSGWEFAAGWDKETLDKFTDVWARWHLNDMRPGCEHQRDWDTSEKIGVIQYTYTDLYTTLSKMEKTMPERLTSLDKENLALGKKAFRAFLGYGNGTRGDVLEACEAGLLRTCGIEEKLAGWVYPTQHEKGLLTKPCPVCGYKYGSAWLKEELPQDVFDFIDNLPHTDIAYPWR